VAAPAAAPPVPERRADTPAAALAAYACPNCGGDAHWSPLKHTLVCSSCGTALPAPPRDGVAATLKLRSLDVGLRDAPTEEQLDSQDEDRIAVACSNCHGVSYFNVGTAADRCQFCGSTAIVPYDALGDRERPQCVLPFLLNEGEARDSARKWYKTRWLSPRKFKKAARMDVVRGMYLPFWSFDADARGNYVDREGHKGEVADHFEGVLICGAEDVPADLLQKIEWYPADGLRAYNGQYVAGWTVARNRVALATARDYAHDRMIQKLYELARKALRGEKNSHNLKIVDPQYANETYAQLLLPIWVMTYTYFGRPFRLVVNGATGAAAGKAPKSVVKMALIALALGWVWLFFQDPDFALHLPVWLGEGIWWLIKWPFTRGG
jgi:hypothetical protein